MKVEEKNYKGAACLSLSNDTVELLISIAFGPRILFYGFVGGQNFFQVFEEQIQNIQTDKWQIYGGHRLWLAPEVKPRSYYPDNNPVEQRRTGGMVTITAPVEVDTGLQKMIDITLSESGTEVRLNHRIVNHNIWDIELSAWSLSVMNAGGRVVIPHEEYRPHPDCLVPARPLVLWHFTDMSDPRFTWGRRYIQMAQDNAYETKLKIGVCNRQGHMAYILNDEVFIKHHDYIAGATYPDMGCNAEFFTMPQFLEMETLSPLVTLPPGGEVKHSESWRLKRMSVGSTDEEIDAIFTE